MCLYKVRALDKDYSEIYDIQNFSAQHTFECGQYFRFVKEGQGYVFFCKDKCAYAFLDKEQKYSIICKTVDVEHFISFLDLETNYAQIMSSLEGRYSILDSAINFGKGIKILKQDILEVIISFIISANNNIPRIKASIEYICKNLGERKSFKYNKNSVCAAPSIDISYHAFPKLEVLKKQDSSFFKSAGLGYRASQIVQAIEKIDKLNFVSLQEMSTKDLKKQILQIKGVGNKVADCILLFGFSRKDVFPVDTWIDKVYKDHFALKDAENVSAQGAKDKTEKENDSDKGAKNKMIKSQSKNREQMAQTLCNMFKDLSGYAQQYLFYYKREMSRNLKNIEN